jgi:AraC-like DNA-binding protein
VLQHLGDGSFSFSDAINIAGEGRSPFVMGLCWLLEVLDLEAGEFYFFCDDEVVRPDSSRFAVFYPPFSIVDMYGRDVRGLVAGVGSVTLHMDFPCVPMIFEVGESKSISNLVDAERIFSASINARAIPITAKPSLLSVKTKRLIDENYRDYPSIRRIADRLNVSHEHLSRQFKNDFRLPPSAYLHKLRMAEANYKLATGGEIVDVSNEVGYNDLSRFYKQFKKQNKKSPGTCKTILRKNAAK